MSQHRIEAGNSVGKKLSIIIGYDRILDYVHCTVMGPKGTIVYSNTGDKYAGIDLQDVRYFEAPLASLGIKLPEIIYEQVESDQLLRVGNRVVTYNQDGSIATEYSG